MTGVALVALVVAAAVAVGDWVAVVTGNKKLEYVCKPGVMVALGAVALAVESDDPSGRRVWIVVALACSLAGDVFLMVKERDLFIPGLASFLLAHLAYIAAFSRGGGDVPIVALAILVLVPVLVRIVLAARRDDAVLGGAVAVYGLVILAMGIAVFAAAEPVAAVGAVLFMTSDALIGWSKFVDEDLGWAPIVIIVTYHLAQAALVLSLLT